MERLTNENHKELGFCAYVGSQNPFKTPLTIGELAGCINVDYSPRKILEDILNRLAAYEDAMPLERAQELAQIEKEGRMGVLEPNAYNDPLTMEQLLEMEGDPVWDKSGNCFIVRINVHGTDGYGADKFATYTKLDILCKHGLYRRKPEEGTN